MLLAHCRIRGIDGPTVLSGTVGDILTTNGCYPGRPDPERMHFTNITIHLEINYITRYEPNTEIALPKYQYHAEIINKSYNRTERIHRGDDHISFVLCTYVEKEY